MTTNPDSAPPMAQPSALHTVALANCRVEPWRNGGGSTQTLLCWPSAADWQLRMSVARIDQDGPFSAFPGLMRWFAVIQGGGVRLRAEQTWGPDRDTPAVTGVKTTPGATGAHAEFFGPGLTVRVGDAPLAFDGAWAPDCSCLNGPTQDLNFMVQAVAGDSIMASAQPGDAGLQGCTRWRGLYSASPLLLLVDGQPHTVGAHSLVWSDAAGPQDWRIALPQDLKSSSTADRQPAQPSIQAWWLALRPLQTAAPRA